VALVEGLAASRPTYGIRSVAAPLPDVVRFRADPVLVVQKPNRAYAGTLYRFVAP
jgi:hypothetical protein